MMAGSAEFDAKPDWPYAKVNGKQLDKDVRLPAPVVEGETVCNVVYVLERVMHIIT